MILFGGHAAQQESELRGRRWLWAGVPVSTSQTIFNDRSWHAPYSAIGLRITAANSGQLRTGLKGFRSVPWDCYIEGYTMLGNAAGTITFDITKAAIADFPPTRRQTIVPLSAYRPRLVAESTAQDFSLYGWTRVLKKGDVLGFEVLRASGLNTCTLTLLVSRNNQP